MTSQPPVPAASTSPYPLNAAPPSALMGADLDDDADTAFDEDEIDDEPIGPTLGVIAAVAAVALSVAGGILLARGTAKKKPAARRKAKRATKR